MLSATISPNPNHGAFELRIQVPRSGHAAVHIFDLSGVELYTTKVFVLKGEFSKQFNLNLQPGIYIFKVKVGSELFEEKIIIEQ